MNERSTSLNRAPLLAANVDVTMVFSSWTPHGASGDTPPVGQRPEARGPAAAAGSGVFGYTILDSARPVQRRRQAASGRRRVHVGRHRHGTHTVPTRYRGQYAPRTLCWHAKLATDSTPKFERDGQLLRGFLADGLCTDRGRLASILEGNIARAQAQQCILCHSVCRVEFFVLSLARFPWTYT